MKIPKNMNTAGVKIVGHRGASGLAPENTLASFNKALEIGVDFIELDIHLSADNQLIVMHDSNVERTTNGTGEIENLTTENIKKLEAGSWFDRKYSSEKVPTLKEVFELIGDKCKVLIEIKWPVNGIYEGIAERLVEYLEEEQLIKQVIIQSFEVEYLKQVMKINSNIECHQLLFGKSSVFPIYYDTRMRFGRFKPIENITSINSFYIYMDKNPNKTSSMQTGVFTVNKKEDMLKVAAMGATFVITDYPNIAVESLH